MFPRLLAISLIAVLCLTVSRAQTNSIASDIHAYLQPYVSSGNFAGSVLVEKSGKRIFAKSYGFADRERRLPNTAETRFRIASMSMQFTAAAVMRLVDTGSVRLDERINDFDGRIEGGEKITIRDLLTERSGLPDINSFPNYNDVLQRHQTPSSLVAAIEGKPLLFEPGSKFLHEEHSAYNVLALIIEKKTGLPFVAAVEKLVFRPADLKASGVDDDSGTDLDSMAKGYAPQGVRELSPAPPIHWSAKAGNASVYTTASDEARWVDLLFHRDFLSLSSREAVLDRSMRVGYGWFKGELKRFGKDAYYMNGRAPGFSSFVLYVPETQTTVVVLSNIYSSATTPIGYDLTAISLGLPYEKLHFSDHDLTPAELRMCTGTFQFGSDFYQQNAKLELIASGQELSLRWPAGGGTSVLLPIDQDRFIDRSYWVEVRIVRDSSGKPKALIYDNFRGVPVPSGP